jgi:riboflavin biosynthesis pyrimidine reductase
VRVLIDALTGTTGEVPPDRLPALYASPRTPWLRVNMVSTVDGAVSGADGRSGSINNAVDKAVFHTLRSLADAVVVGAGTARAERYGEAVAPVVVVSRRGDVPDRLASVGTTLLVTCASSPGLARARDVLGDDRVLVAGQDAVDLRALRVALAHRGLVDLLAEGGPSLLGSLLAADVVDELCTTVVPLVVGGGQGRIAAGPDFQVPLRLGVLLEERGTLLSRWLVAR